jgi:hypothetical protein
MYKDKMKYKGYDIVNYHTSTYNTNPEIKNILQEPYGRSSDLMCRNREVILKITYDNLIQHIPNIQYHMTCMKYDTFNSSILIFEKQFDKPFENPFENTNIDSNITNMLGRHTHSSVIKLNVIKIEPTDDSMCGELNPEICISARTVTIHGKHVEWANVTRINENNNIVPVLCDVTAANRWGVVLRSLAKLYPRKFSQYFSEFLHQYPQTDIEIIGSNYSTYILIVAFCMLVVYVVCKII